MESRTGVSEKEETSSDSDTLSREELNWLPVWTGFGLPAFLAGSAVGKLSVAENPPPGDEL